MKNIKKCLIIDDDTDDQELFALALSELNMDIECATANNGSEGLQYLRSNPLPDIIFLDLNMPKMNGKDCLRAIKADPLLNKIPVVILSTSVDPTDKKETLDLGAVQFIAKPSSISVFTAILAEIITLNKLSETNY